MFLESDFDKLQQIMEESPEKRELLERLLESHQMTISAISHEIRNPLTLIYSTLQLISSQHPETSSFKYWKQLIKDVEYTNLLLEELSIYNNSDRLALTPTDTASFFKTTALSFAASITDTDIEFTSRISEELPEINCDSIKLRQVVLNLLRNAQDGVLACEELQRKILLDVQPLTDDSGQTFSVCVKISDNGCGIAQEDIYHIFKRFYRSSRSADRQGVGLGLPLAKAIIEGQGGTLSVASEEGEGTVFYVSLFYTKSEVLQNRKTDFTGM